METIVVPPDENGEGGYTDYILRSSAPTSATGWKYNVMKFATLADRVIDLNHNPTAFQHPLRLNRKDPRTVRRLADEEIERYSKALEPGPEEVAAMAAAAIMEDVKDEHGVVIAKRDKDGKEIPIKEEMDPSLVGRGVKGNAAVAKKKGSMFQKKTKRVYVASEENRRLRREEWMPWVLEDKDANERWIGRLEGGTGEANSASAANALATQTANAAGTGNAGWRPTGSTSEAGGGGSSYVAFVFGENGDDFKVIPASRWYKFNQGPKYAMLGVDEAESEYIKLQKNQAPERWLMHKRTNTPIASTSTSSATTSAAPPSANATNRLKLRTKGESSSSRSKPAASSIRSRMLDKSNASNESKFSIPGRKFQTVVSGRDHAQGDDEHEYEADFQDDEEGIARQDDLVNEDDQKDIEARMKKEFKAAKGFESADEEESDDEKRLTTQGDEIKRLVKQNDKTGLYDSDDEDGENPYLSDFDQTGSEVDSFDLEASAALLLASNLSLPAPTTGTTSSSSRPSKSDRRSSSSSQHPSSKSTRPPSGWTSNSHSNSRTGSTAPSGSALIAKRATSPHSSRAPSPSLSRGSSPVGSASGSGGGNSSSKRKRTETGTTSDTGEKRRKAGEGSQSPPPSSSAVVVPLLTAEDIIAFLKAGPSTTANLLAHFRKAVRDERNRKGLQPLIASVASMEKGLLTLKPEFA